MIDFSNVKSVTLGGSNVKKIMRGSDVLWEAGSGPEPVGPDYLCFEAAEAGSSVSMNGLGSAPTVSLEYSTDKQTWASFIVGTTTVTLQNVGDKVYLRGDNVTFAIDGSNYNKFTATGRIYSSGNVMSIFDKSAESVSFSSNSACRNLFNGNASLLSAPSLPATELTVSCYSGMFRSCTNLVTGPELPATVLPDRCYENMFYSCVNMESEFLLPATTLGNYCYNSIFRNCSKVSSIEVHFLEWVSFSSNWVTDVAASGTFKCPSALDTSIRDVSHVPVGWAVVNV